MRKNFPYLHRTRLYIIHSSKAYPRLCIWPESFYVICLPRVFWYIRKTTEINSIAIKAMKKSKPLLYSAETSVSILTEVFCIEWACKPGSVRAVARDCHLSAICVTAYLKPPAECRADNISACGVAPDRVYICTQLPAVPVSFYLAFPSVPNRQNR